MATVPGGRAGWVIQILPLGGHGLSINRVVLVLLRKVFGGTGILPVRVHRLKTCATKVYWVRTVHHLSTRWRARTPTLSDFS